MVNPHIRQDCLHPLRSSNSSDFLLVLTGVKQEGFRNLGLKKILKPQFFKPKNKHSNNIFEFFIKITVVVSASHTTL